MAFYSDDIIQQLKTHADIVNVIQQFVPLKKSGSGRYVGKCPFHDDHSPSMNVNPQLGIYKCFACGAGGDVFKFVMEHEKMDFRSAVEWVANDTGFALPSLGAPENKEIAEERELVKALNELADKWFQEQLKLNDAAREYIEGRGVTPEIQKLFHIGFAPEGREGFLTHAAKKGFSPRQVVQAGLAVERESGGIADKFRNRLMFAIQNLTGMVVAFGGRIIEKNPNAPKYLNSPDTALYSKGNILYGLTHSRQEIAKTESVILVEGYFDLISLYQAGVHNVVAVSGTALTDMHASILARYAKTAYLVFDGDAAGRKATHRSLEIILPHGIAPRIFSLSRANGEKIDPDNFVHENSDPANAFRAELGKAEDFLSYLAHTMPTDSPENRAAFITYAKSLIKSVREDELRNQYLQLLSERFNTNANLFRVRAIDEARFKKHSRAPVPQLEPGPETEMPAAPAAPQVQWAEIPTLELRFVTVIFKTQSLWPAAATFFDLEFSAADIPFFEAPLIRELLESGLALYAETQSINLVILHGKLTPTLAEILEGLPDEVWTEETAQKEFLESIMELETRTLDRFRDSLKQREATDDVLRLRLDIHSESNILQKLLRTSRADNPDCAAIFKSALDARTKLLYYGEKVVSLGEV